MTADKPTTMDAAETPMLDLMDRHPGASKSSLLTLIQDVAREKPEVLRAIVGHFLKHSSVNCVRRNHRSDHVERNLFVQQLLPV